MDDLYIIRLRERPQTMGHELLVLRRVGSDQVEWLNPARVTGQRMEWRWERAESGVTLEPWQGVVLELPTDALPALAEAVHRVLGTPPATAEAAVLREAWKVERDRNAKLLDMLATALDRAT